MLRVLGYAAIIGALVWALHEFGAPEADEVVRAPPPAPPPQAPDEEARPEEAAPPEAPREKEPRPDGGLLGLLSP